LNNSYNTQNRTAEKSTTLSDRYLWKQSLCEKFFRSSTELNVEQSVVSFPDFGVPEPAKTELDHRPVVQDLGQGISVRDRVLQ
jgi:hypothetical protein